MNRSRRLLVAALLAVAVAGAGCTAPTDDVAAPPSPVAAPVGVPAPTPDAGARPIVVDTDLGGDDLLALLHLLVRTDVDVRAVTISGTGLVHCPAGVDLARSVIASVVGPDRSIPVACGRDTAPSGEEFPADWRRRADAGSGASVPAPAEGLGAAPVWDAGAAPLIVEVVTASDGPVTVLALGPMTNLADALDDPSADLLAAGTTVHAMGGTLDEATPTEWNVRADPASWEAVLTSGLDLTLVLLEVTEAVAVDVAALPDALEGSDLAASHLVRSLLDGNDDLRASAAMWWDVWATLALLDAESVGATEERDGSVVVTELRSSRLGPSFVAPFDTEP